jgi:acetyl-CoA synthetase
LTQERYREICDAFHWQVPVRFNIARECCGRWAHERERIALYYEDDAGHTGVYTYRDLQQQANRLSNALVALGVKRGDRVAIVLPQRPETAIAHIACYQMGAVAMPLSVLFGPDALEYRLQNSEAVVALGEEASLPNPRAGARSVPAPAAHHRYRRTRAKPTFTRGMRCSTKRRRNSSASTLTPKTPPF